MRAHCRHQRRRRTRRVGAACVLALLPTDMLPFVASPQVAKPSHVAVADDAMALDGCTTAAATALPPLHAARARAAHHQRWDSSREVVEVAPRSRVQSSSSSTTGLAPRQASWISLRQQAAAAARELSHAAGADDQQRHHSHQHPGQQEQASLAAALAELAAARQAAAQQAQQLVAAAHELEQLHASLPAARQQLRGGQARLHAAQGNLAQAQREAEEAGLAAKRLASLRRQLQRVRDAAAAALQRGARALAAERAEEAAAVRHQEEAEAVADICRQRFNEMVREHRPAARPPQRRGAKATVLLGLPPVARTAPLVPGLTFA